VPSGWAALWQSGPEAPAPWIKQAVARLIALQGWAQQLESGSLLRGAVRLNELLDPNHKPNPNPNPNPNPDPNQVRLNELLNPGFFLTALRQQTARVSQLPMDGTHLVSNPNPSPSPNPNPSLNPYPTQACTLCAH